MSTIIAKTSKQLLITENLIYFNKYFSTTNSFNRSRNKIDLSKVPVIKEKELSEQFVHGSGPGGQNVNKLSNCVVLKHLPTGIVVKCHQQRLQQKNRLIARQLLQTKLDDLMNGSESVSEQKRRIIESKYSYREKRAAKLRNLKKEFKLSQESEVIEELSRESKVREELSQESEVRKKLSEIQNVVHLERDN